MKTTATLTPAATWTAASGRSGPPGQRKENTVMSRITLCATGCVLAGLALSSIDARGGSGSTVSRSQETAIKAGMSASDVRQLLGRPARAVQYRNAPGPFWAYDVLDPLFGKTEFLIDFGPDEK